jgi:hypothetical protein
VFSFGSARFYGSMGGRALNQPVVGIAATPDGDGYWEVAADGGVFSFGSARFYGSMGGRALNQPVVDMVASQSGNGYWEVARDGGLFSFGATVYTGSVPGVPGSGVAVDNVVGAAPTPDGGGYFIVGSDSTVYNFGDAEFSGGGTSPDVPPAYTGIWAANAPPAVAVISEGTGPQAAHSGHVRAVNVGDSLSWLEWGYSSTNDPPVTFFNGATPGCGITNGAAHIDWQQPTEVFTASPVCAAWPQQWNWATHYFHPDVVVVLVGYWESQNRLYGGTYQNLSDPDYYDFIESNLEAGLDILHEGGADVVLQTAPYYGDGTPDAMVDDMNQIIDTVGAQDSSWVTIMDVNQLLDPEGTYTASPDGILARTSDDVHLTQAGVTQILDPVLFPLVSALGTQVFDSGS